MPGPWIINVDGRAYGPYGADEMRAFAAQGRVVAMSQVARAGETEFRNALDDPDLASLFVPSRTTKGAVTESRRQRESSFGKLDGADPEAAGLSHFIIIADMKSRSIAGLEEEIANLGFFCPVLPQAWILSTKASINTVRNLLIHQLGKLDVLLVVDATRDKAAWFNFGPEMDARIRRIWVRQAETKIQN